MRDLWDWLRNMLDIHLWMQEAFNASELEEGRIDAILDDLRKNGEVPEIELNQILQLQGIGMNPLRIHRLLRMLAADGLVEFGGRPTSADGTSDLIPTVRLARIS